MAVLKRVVDGVGDPVGWRHECPGCGHRHVIRVEQAWRNGARWTFDGDEASPTFSPSINERRGHYCDNGSEADCKMCQAAKSRGYKTACGVCHYFINKGRIQFCSDSTHPLAGQTVDLPEIIPIGAL